MGPRKTIHTLGVTQQVVRTAHDHLSRLHVDVEYEAAGWGTRKREAPSLSDRDEFDSIDGADVVPLTVADARRTELDAVAEECPAAAVGGDEAHVLAVGLRGRSEAYG